MKRNRWLKIAMSAVLVILGVASIAQAQVNMLPLSPYSQDFNTLSNTAGSTTNILTITGWYISETGTSARVNQQYAVDTGSSNTGDTFSYGAAGNTDRALGSLRSGTITTTMGAGFVNNTTGTIGQISIAYNCEEWRYGVAVARTDQMDFQYSTDATSLTTGTWTNVDALDCITTNTTGTAGARDGNTIRTPSSATITGLSISNGNAFWIRWVDADAPGGADDGLAVDDFSLTLFAPNAVTLNDLSASTTASPAPLIVGGLGVAAAALLLRRKLTRPAPQN